MTDPSGYYNVIWLESAQTVGGFEQFLVFGDTAVGQQGENQCAQEQEDATLPLVGRLGGAPAEIDAPLGHATACNQQNRDYGHGLLAPGVAVHEYSQEEQQCHDAAHGHEHREVVRVKQLRTRLGRRHEEQRRETEYYHQQCGEKQPHALPSLYLHIVSVFCLQR